MAKVIGIDLGTTNSAMAYMEGGEPTIIPNAEGGRITPSVVAFTKTGERLVGQLAKRQAITNPENTIYSIKRFMGRRFSDPEVQRSMKMVPYKVVEASNGGVEIQLGDGRRLSPPEISAMILQKLKQDAEAYLGEPVAQAVITVPAYFDDAQRQATKDQGIDLRNDRMALQRLKEAAEKAKIELSSTMQSEINLPFITADQSGPKHLVMTLTRSKLEQLVGDLVEKTIPPVQQCLKDADVTAADIDEIVLVGGQTRMPLVQDTVKRVFNGKEPHKGINPDEVVALGAAVQAGVLKGEVKDVLLLDVTPLTLGIETLGGVRTPLITRNTTIPTSKSQIFTTASDGQTQVEIHVLQGEREMAADNKSLGRFILDGIPPAPRGVPQIEVTFDIDANGILNVSAKDKASGKEQKITITATSGLTKDEVEKLVRDAQAHAEEDRRRKEMVEARNLADTLAYQTEKALKDAGDKVPADVRSEVEAKIRDVRAALEGSDVARIKSTTEALTQAAQKIGQYMYQQQPGAEA